MLKHRKAQEDAPGPRRGKRVPSHPAQRPGRWTTFTAWLKVAGMLASLVAAVVLMVAVFIYGPYWLGGKYNEGKPMARIDCTVKNAHGGPLSVNKKNYHPEPKVLIGTFECGSLVMSKGIDEGNAESVAAKLSPGETFSFEVLPSTKASLPVKKFLHQYSWVDSFEEAG